MDPKNPDKKMDTLPTHLDREDLLAMQLLRSEQARIAAEQRALNLQTEVVQRELAAKYQVNNGDTFDLNTGEIKRVS